MFKLESIIGGGHGHGHCSRSDIFPCLFCFKKGIEEEALKICKYVGAGLRESSRGHLFDQKNKVVLGGQMGHHNDRGCHKK